MKINVKRPRILPIIVTLLLAAVMALSAIAFSAADQTPAEGYDLNIYAQNLNFGSEVSIVYYVQENIPVEGLKLLVWSDSSKGFDDPSTAKKVLLPYHSTMPISGKNYRVFLLNGLAAKEMADDMYARVSYTENGVTYYGKVAKYSVLQYVYNKLGITGNASSNENFKTALVKMLEYGAATQSYFGYKTNRLANSKFYQITIKNGTLSDGFKKGLYVTGESVTMTAPATDASGNTFKFWQNSSGQTISESLTYTATVGTMNETFTAYYENAACTHTNTTVTAPVLPTATTAGLTEGIICSDCGAAILEAYDPDKYQSRQGYEYLGGLENGKNLQEAYNRLNKLAQTYHLNSYNGAGTDSITDFADVSDLNIYQSDLYMLVNTYSSEHQLYYWYNGSTYYYDDETLKVSRIAFTVNPDYTDPSVRAQLNLDIYETVQEMAVDNMSKFDTARIYHDTILSNMEYAYISGTNTPETASWAHNVEGYVRKGKGVCETYAEIFHIMMNFSGIDCIRVHGSAGGPHAWNLAKMDNGGWYWFDLTWDDYDDGFNYDYFCVNDTETIFFTGPFLSSHTASTPNSGSEFLFELPARATTAYDKTAIGAGFALPSDPYETFSYIGSDRSTDIVLIGIPE